MTTKKTILIIAIILCMGTILIAQDWGSGQSQNQGQNQRPPIFCADDFEDAVDFTFREAGSFLRAANTGTRPRIAVTEILAPGRNYNHQWTEWARGILEETITRQGTRFMLFERDRLDLIIAERGFQTGRGYDEKELIALGVQAGVQFVIYGEIQDTPRGPVFVLRLISVNDGRSFTARARNGNGA
jgi:hypothetical protein